MKKLALSLTALGALAFCAPGLAAEHTVKMLNSGADGVMVFEPAYLKVAPGDTVVFEATTPAHNSVAFHVPAGAQPWSGAMSQTVRVTLEQEGVYLYKCEPHVPLGMVGVIQVGKPANLAEAKAAAEAFKPAVAVNKERLDRYLGQVK